MVTAELVNRQAEVGARILRELDHRGFPVYSMFWIHRVEFGYWLLIIASPLVSEQGSLKAYERLDQILQGMESELAGVDIGDISVLDPRSPEFGSFLAQASTSSRRISGPEWVELEDAVVYRWNNVSVSGEIDCDVTREDLMRFWEAQRKKLPGSRPAILIDMDGRRVTLRFHPQHGPQQSIEGIKQAFSIALHQEARPDCHIAWLD